MKAQQLIVVVALSFACTGNDEVSLGSDGCRAPQRAVGSGQCDQGLGVKWNGQQCEAIGGCECIGADCGDLFADFDSCMGACGGGACTSALPGTTGACPGNQYCQFPNYGCASTSDFVGTCSLRPAECQATDQTPVCGCDGRDYADICLASAEGVGVASFGTCGR